MKLKNIKQGKKQIKKQQAKPQVEEVTKTDDYQEPRDDALIDIKQDLKKKQQPKPKVTKRLQSNKLEQQEIDTSKILIEKKEDAKKPVTSWVVKAEDVKELLKEDFKHVDHDFESLTDTKLNLELKQKKQKERQEQKTQNVGQFKFAPLAGDHLDSKTTDKLTLGKPKTQTQPIGFSTAPALKFTNSNLNGNVNVAPLQKSPQLYDDEIERKMAERLAQTKKIEAQSKPVMEKGKNWFKQPTKQALKQAPKIEFKSTPLTFTNSALTKNSEQQEFKGFQPLEKSKQEQIYERKEQNYKFVNKKEQQERRKKRQEQAKLQTGKVQTLEKA